MNEENDSILLLHASDFHVKEHEGNPMHIAHDIRKLFIFDAERLSKKIGSPTALVFSGDIAATGQEGEYCVAEQMFGTMYEQLKMVGKHIWLVPGNHDIDRNKTIDLDARMLRDSLRKNTIEAAENEFFKNPNMLLQPLSAYQDFAGPYNCQIKQESMYWEINTTNSSSVHDYMAVNFDIYIRGISTVSVSDQNDKQMDSLKNSKNDGSHMFVARGQLFDLPKRDDDDTPFSILIGHHPPSWWRFTENMKAIANTRFHLHLFGHEHQFAPQLSGNAICLKAGAVNPEAVNPDDPDYDPTHGQPRYNWIKIMRGKFKNNDGYVVRIWSRVYDESVHDFVEDGDWQGGAGYWIDQNLKIAPKKLKPEREPSDIKKDKANTDDKNIDIETTPGSIEIKKRRVTTVPSSNKIRLALLSQDSNVYAGIFKQLGYEPGLDEKYILGGLEFYENALKELLLPQNISKLIEVMNKEGISIN